MPFRTRDFLLFLLSVGVILVGITSTVISGVGPVSQNAAVIFTEADSEVIYAAAATEQPDINSQRSSRLNDLKNKISQLTIGKPAPEPEVLDTPADDAAKPADNGEILTCGGYGAYTGLWQPAGLKFEISEGARLVYRDKIETESVLNASGTLEVINREVKEVILQLPLPFGPQGKACLSHDVVGVALDGSLIRNNEHSLYQVFGSETLIGYALDGFPIYGLNKSTQLDACGGSSASGSYRYYLSESRKGVLGCFSGSPTRL